MTKDFMFIHKDENDPSTRSLMFGPFEENEESEIVEIDDNWTMPHILHHCGLFPSLTQARKNTTDENIPSGFTMFHRKKKSIHITIFNKMENNE